MALGAFLAGLLLAETEFSLQVESDIAPYRGLLLGLFFMTVGAEYKNSQIIYCFILFVHVTNIYLDFQLWLQLQCEQTIVVDATTIVVARSLSEPQYCSFNRGFN